MAHWLLSKAFDAPEIPKTESMLTKTSILVFFYETFFLYVCKNAKKIPGFHKKEKKISFFFNSKEKICVLGWFFSLAGIVFI